MDNYSSLIKELRIKLGMTQKEMSDFLGVSFATLNRWENGHFNPTFKYKTIISRICKDFGVKYESNRH